MKRETAEQYADNVAGSKVIACEYVRLAVRRHFSDLDNAVERGLYFDRKAAQRAINFIHKLRHTKGEFAGRAFILEPWQQFVVWNIFGWMRADGSRRFRNAYIEVARKNGKTALAAGVSLYMLYADSENRAEVYSVATKRDQARLCFDDAAAIVRATALKSRFKIFERSITYEATGSRMMPLSADYNTQDGLNPSCAIIDEYHAHKTNGMYDVIRSGMGARRQPLIFIITTAGDNMAGPCYDFRDNVVKVLQGVNTDDSLFGVIFTLDNDDEINDPQMWAKANPNMGVSVKVEFLEEQLLHARNKPSDYVPTMTKNFNRWMQASEVWLADEKWMACVGDFTPEQLAGKRCHGGLDLANVSDLVAFVLEFHENGKTQVLPFFWIPEETMQERVRSEHINYDVWQRRGFINVTPGNVVDYDFIKADIKALAERYNVESIAYDRYNSSQLVIDLQKESLTLTPFGQGYVSMSTPIKDIERIILSKELEHGGHPVLRWNISNIAVSFDPAGNIKFDKKKAKQKIDGAVAMAMAHGEYMTSLSEKKDSVYEKRGLR